jgi:hypothetical protein
VDFGSLRRQIGAIQLRLRALALIATTGAGETTIPLTLPSFLFSNSSFSLVIHRKDIGDILGAYLIAGEKNSMNEVAQFYALPESAGDTAVSYKIPSGAPFTLQLLAGGNQGFSNNTNSSPSVEDMEITIEFVDGAKKKLPDNTPTPLISSPSWDLNQYSSGDISVLRAGAAATATSSRSYCQPCEHAGGILFLERSEAQRHCAIHTGSARGEPAHPAPPDHQTVSWCCRDGHLFEELWHPCEQSGGVPFHGQHEAQRHCAGDSARQAPDRAAGFSAARHQPAHCWLKDAAPAAIADHCCESVWRQRNG